MKELFDKSSYDFNDIKSIIENGFEESQYLDFKESRAIGKTPEIKKEISKDVSAFANTSGGIIVYGIEEKDGRAFNYSYINGEEFTIEWLQQVISSNIQRRIQGVEIFPIRFNGDLKQTIYLVKIPESTNAPHQAWDKKFYKRDNTESIAMLEYEIRNIYNRKVKSSLVIENIETILSSTTGPTNQLRDIDFNINVLIKNTGNTVEQHYKLEVQIPNIITGNTSPVWNANLRKDDIYTYYSMPNISPLFQDEEYKFPPIRIRITRRYYIQPNENLVKIRLYFTSGNDMKEYDISDKMLYQGRLLSESDFYENS